MCQLFSSLLKIVTRLKSEFQLLYKISKWNLLIKYKLYPWDDRVTTIFPRLASLTSVISKSRTNYYIQSFDILSKGIFEANKLHYY